MITKQRPYTFPSPRMVSAGLSVVSPRFGSSDSDKKPDPPKFSSGGNKNVFITVMQWFREFFKNLGGLFFPPEQPTAHVHHHTTSEKATDTIEKLVAKATTYPKISGACFDRLTSEGHSQHTHHTVHEGPVVHGHGEDQKTTFWVGETVSNTQGLDLDAGQKAVQVNLNLLKNYLKTVKDPLNLENLPEKAFQKIKSICFDFPNGEHTHHGLYTGPTVTVPGKEGQSKIQQTAILVGQWLCANMLREKGLKIDKDVQMGILVTDNLFQESKQVTHAY